MKKTEVLKPGGIPTRDQLFKALENPETAFAVEQLNNLLNQPPHQDWIKKNNGNEYLPIDKVEFMLTYIFQTWEWKILREGILANSVYVTGAITVIHPVTKKEWTQYGIGAVPIQLNSGSKPSNLSELRALSIQMNLPAAASFAMSNAAGRFGKIFGRDLNRKETLQFIGGFSPEEAETTKTVTVTPLTKEQVEEVRPDPLPVTPIQSQKVNIEL